MSKPSSYSGMNKLDIWDNEGSSSNLSCKQKLLQSCDFQLSPSVFFYTKAGGLPCTQLQGEPAQFQLFHNHLNSPQKFLSFPFPSAHTSTEHDPAAQVLWRGARHTSELQAQFWQTFPNDLHKKELLDWPISSILNST